MRRIWIVCQWEMKKDLSGRLISQCVVMAGSFLVFLLYKLAKLPILHVMNLLKGLPAPLLAFAGIRQETQTGSVNFYLLATAALMGVGYLMQSMRRCAESVYEDERSGMELVMLNQWFSRSDLSIGRFVYQVGCFLAGSLLWFLEIALLIVVGSITAMQRSSWLLSLVNMELRYAAVGILLLAVIYFFACAPREGLQIAVGDTIALVLGGTLLLGNLYKLRDVILWGLKTMGNEGTTISKLFGWLDGLYWVSPLSWLNPFMEKGVAVTAIICVVCLILAFVLFILAGECFERRKIEA